MKIQRSLKLGLATFAVALFTALYRRPPTEWCGPMSGCGFSRWLYDYQTIIAGIAALIGGATVLLATAAQLWDRARERRTKDIALGAGMATEIASHGHALAFAAMFLSKTGDREIIALNFTQGFRFYFEQAQKMIATRLPTLWSDLGRVHPRVIEPMRHKIQALEAMYVESQPLLDWWQRLSVDPNADFGMVNTDYICFRIIDRYRRLDPPAQHLENWQPARPATYREYQGGGGRNNVPAAPQQQQ